MAAQIDKLFAGKPSSWEGACFPRHSCGCIKRVFHEQSSLLDIVQYERCHGLTARHYPGGTKRARKYPVYVSLKPFDAARNAPQNMSAQIGRDAVLLTCLRVFADTDRSVPSAHSQKKCALFSCISHVFVMFSNQAL